MKPNRKERYEIILKYLQEAYPKAFPASEHLPLPLKIGVSKQLTAELRKAKFKRWWIPCFADMWFDRLEYNAALALGGPRYNLNGEIKGFIAPWQQFYAMEKCETYVDRCRNELKFRGVSGIEIPDCPIEACSPGSFLLSKEMRRMLHNRKRKQRRNKIRWMKRQEENMLLEPIAPTCSE